MKKLTFGIILVFALLALVSVASAALPTSVTADIQNPAIYPSYWKVDVQTVTPVMATDIKTTPDYAGWCGASGIYITSGLHPFEVYSTLGTQGSVKLHPNMNSVNWQKINWVINHKPDGITKYTLQAVFWYYDGGVVSWGSPQGTPTTGMMGQLIADADAAITANNNWQPGYNQVYAVVLFDPQNPGQPVFIEVPIPDIPSPEFPTLALPVAMIIGLVGAVQFIRTREEE